MAELLKMAVVLRAAKYTRDVMTYGSFGVTF
jgi:hypothetical protein